MINNKEALIAKQTESIIKQSERIGAEKGTLVDQVLHAMRRLSPQPRGVLLLFNEERLEWGTLERSTDSAPIYRDCDRTDGAVDLFYLAMNLGDDAIELILKYEPMFRRIRIVEKALSKAHSILNRATDRLYILGETEQEYPPDLPKAREDAAAFLAEQEAELANGE